MRNILDNFVNSLLPGRSSSRSVIAPQALLALPKTPKHLCKIFLLALTFLIAISARAGAPELPLESHVESSNAPLTTEMVWAIDPDEFNPHRTRWVLERHLELSGLKAVEDKGITFPKSIISIRVRPNT